MLSALLRHFRHRRGLSQLDLALSAEVSARHISFVETGRALPSRDMLLVLGQALDLTLRDQNTLLQAGGFAPAFSEPSFDDGIPEPIDRAIDRMLALHEPYPITVLNRRYEVLRANPACMRILGQFVRDPSALTSPLNVLKVLFDPRLARHFVVDWEQLARAMLTRLHREELSQAMTGGLSELLRELLAFDGVPQSFRVPDLSAPSDPTMVVRLARGELELAFLTTVTVFNAPQNVMLEELRIESYFPLDRETERACAQMAREG